MIKLDRTVFTGCAALVLLFASAAPAAGAPTSAAVPCESKQALSLTDLDRTFDVKCDYKLALIDVGYGLSFGIPAPGDQIAGSALVAAGFAEIPTVTVLRTSAGQVAVRVGSLEYGAAAARSEFRPEIAVNDGAPAIQTAASTKCSSGAYKPYNWVWIGPYKYWYNSSGQPSTASLPRINAGVSTVAAGTTGCGTTIANNAVASYQGAGSYVPSVTATPGCTGVNDGHSTIGWKAISSSAVLAYTCYLASGASGLDADTVFDTSGHSWFVGASTTGCPSGFYDLQSVATHEAGHEFGLDHVAQSTAQVMRPTTDPCVTSDRTLGLGDATGMNVLY